MLSVPENFRRARVSVLANPCRSGCVSRYERAFSIKMKLMRMFIRIARPLDESVNGKNHGEAIVALLL